MSCTTRAPPARGDRPSRLPGRVWRAHPGAYALDRRQFLAGAPSVTSVCSAPSAGDIELYPRDLEERGKARATIGPQLSTSAGFYRYAAEEGLIEHSSAVHVRRPRIDYESHAIGLDRNELGAFLVVAGLASPEDHALASLLALTACGTSEGPPARSRCNLVGRAAPGRHPGDVVNPVDHGRARVTEDRSWTLALVDRVRARATPGVEREEALTSLAYLEDYRSIGSLTAVVEDGELPEPIRRRASEVLRGFDDTSTPEQRRRWWATADGVLMAHALGMMERSEADIVVAVAADDAHPLQAKALDAMAFGYDEAQFQPVKIRALDHPAPAVREAAADVLIWDEPVAAEHALLAAAGDSSVDVAEAAVDTLQYYASRRVLRALSELLDAADEALRAQAAESFEFVRDCFAAMATDGDPSEVGMLREWMEPVRDLVAWPDEIRPPKGSGRPPGGRARDPMPEIELRRLLEDPDGEWADRKAALRNVAWEPYGPSTREQLTRLLAEHPDPVVREIGTAALAAWARSAELIALSADASFSVRKAAMYQLALVPSDPSLAEPAWSYMASTQATTAHEALVSYVTHAPAAEARGRLAELARTDPREAVVTRAISCLVDLHAAPEVGTLLAMLEHPPGVSWAVHIALLDAVRALELEPPAGLDHLAAVDNLYLVRSVTAVRAVLG